jgi:membrane peptidoglycan carboxypeptidase
VTLQSLTAAYSAFAAAGVMHEPYLVRRVEDQDGNVLYATEAKEHRVFSEETAFMVTSMLADVINSGTAWRARAEGFRLPAAGKTGTTNDYHDVWFVGYTPSALTGVWMGFDQPREIISNGYAGELAVPLWSNVMAVATDGDKAESFKRPSGVVGVEICRITGKRSVDGCKQVPVEAEDGSVEIRPMNFTEYFRKGTEPRDYCEEHEGANFLERLAGFFGKDNDPKAVSAEQAGLPAATIPRDVPAPQATSEDSPRDADARADAAKDAPRDTKAEAAKDEPEKKRGFSPRLKGRRDKDKEKEKEKDKPR